MDVSTARQANAAAVVLAVTGEVDMAAAPALREAVAEAIADGAVDVTVDLDHTTFLDSAGISALIWARSLADRERCAFRVVNAHDLVDRVLAMTGVYQVLNRQSS
jgi:anti-sigma B factor antagonist